MTRKPLPGQLSPLPQSPLTPQPFNTVRIISSKSTKYQGIVDRIHRIQRYTIACGVSALLVQPLFLLCFRGDKIKRRAIRKFERGLRGYRRINWSKQQSYSMRIYTPVIVLPWVAYIDVPGAAISGSYDRHVSHISHG